MGRRAIRPESAGAGAVEAQAEGGAGEIRALVEGALQQLGGRPVPFELLFGKSDLQIATTIADAPGDRNRPRRDDDGGADIEGVENAFERIQATQAALQATQEQLDAACGEARAQVIDTPVRGDGAGNQGYIDELAVNPWTGSETSDPSAAPYEEAQYAPLMRYPGYNPVQQGVIAMAHSLNLRVVAEGVDAEEQARFLREHGCDEIQGFLFCEAVPAEEIPRFLQKSWLRR